MTYLRKLRRPALLALGLAGCAVVGLGVAPAGAATHAATTVAVLRPVSATGHVVKGWKVVTDGRAPVECVRRSYVAVDSGIDVCGSPADNALACWRSATKGRVLCLGSRDAQTHTLRSIKLGGVFGSAPPVGRQPVVMAMANGMTMYARTGATWAVCKQHPTWVGFYYQPLPGNRTMYGPRGSNGLDTSTAAWLGTIYQDTAKAGYRAYVRAAWFLGNAA